MVSGDTKAEILKESIIGRMHLTAGNEQIARQYLNMDNAENPALLAEIEHQDLADFFPSNGYAEYLKWLRKNKRTEELSRYVRFVVETGGATAWRILTNDNYEARLSELDDMLDYLTGAHAEEQKMAVRAAYCAWQLYKEERVEDVRTFLAYGKEEPEIFVCALKYCYVFQSTMAYCMNYARMFLAAAYLYWKEAGTAEELTEQLVKDLIADIPNITAPAKHFSESEIQCLQDYVKTAKKDTPFPQNVLAICRAREGWMHIVFQSTCAFLALGHSVQFEILFHLMLGQGFKYKSRIEALDIARAVVEDEIFHANMEKIENMLPILDEDYIIWCLYGYPTFTQEGEKSLLVCSHAECEEEIQRMAIKCPDSIRAAVQKADSEEYRKLTVLVQSANPALYEEIHTSYQEVFREKLSSELVEFNFKECRETARQYFLGKCSLDDLLADMKQHGQKFSGYLWNGECKRVNHLKALGEYQFYRRVLVIEALKGARGFFAYYFVSEQSLEESDESLLYDKQQTANILEIFEKEKLPVSLQLEALGNLCDNVEDKKEKLPLLDAYAQAVIDRLHYDKKLWEDGIADALEQEGVSTCCICLKVLTQYDYPEQFKAQIFKFVENSTELLQKQLVTIFKKNKGWEADILTFLASKKLKQRSFAVMVLEEWGNPVHLEAVKAALLVERNKKLVVRLQELVEELESESAEGSQKKLLRSEEVKLAAEIYRGSRRRKIEWVQGITFPTVHFQRTIEANAESDSTQNAQSELIAAEPEYMFAILASYADMEILSVNPDANKLAAPLVQTELADYVSTLYCEWITAGAEAKKRWVLYVAAIYGDAEMISLLHKQIKDWAEHSRGAIAADAVRAIALNGSSQALLLVDQIAQKFKSNQVKNAAKEALDDAASVFGISMEELQDRIVPDLGFNTQMEQTFDYGTRTFTVRLNLLLELEIYDSDNRQLRKLPAPGKQDDAEKAGMAQAALKQLKKQLKLVTASQKLRLEQVFCTARFWQTQAWRRLFVDNPVMHQFAVGLIWGIYEGGQLKGTFRYMEDGSFNTVDEKEYLLPDEGVIGLVHPLELSEELLLAWREQLLDYEIIQPVEQLERPVYRVTDEERNTKKLMRFYGKEVNGASLTGKLLSLGWERGEILDGGFFDRCYRRDDAFGAELTFSGCSVGYANEEVTLDELSFTKIVDDSRSREEFCTLGEVSARYFSETVLQIARIVGD